MVGFYHGTVVPSDNANEGIYFINSNNKYSIYTKVNNKSAEKYAELNEINSQDLTNLWNQIGEDFVSKSFTVAGLEMSENITAQKLQTALELKALAYKNSATGELTDYVTEVVGVDYTPTGKVEINLGYDSVEIISVGNFTPAGEVSGSATSKGTITLAKDSEGFAVTGSVSAPTITINPTVKPIDQIITSLGALPSYTAAKYTAPSLTNSTTSVVSQGMVAQMHAETPGLLVISSAPTVNVISSVDFNSGSYTAASFNPGSLPTINSEISVMTGANATASAPTFTGDKIGATFVGQSSDISATFTGTESEVSVSGQYNKAKINSATFKGDIKTIAPTLQKENKTITVQ